ncbi:MAG: tyrosine-type recombinase/integrase [Clostridiales bacterium]|nr:tyrosine-type recombinase/integrase [Clostridiales bacterium]
MAISARQVKNKKNADGVATGRSGTVYDVSIKYKTGEGYKTYSKRGFITKQDAVQHEAEMKIKLNSPTYMPMDAANSKQTVKEYLETWVESHGKANLRPSTFASYKGYIKNHIVPHLGHIQLKQLTPAMIDDMFQKLYDKDLSHSSVRYTQRILSVALEHARKYRYIETNPARDIITKFGKQGKTPDPYTIPQMQQLISHTIGTFWEMPVILGGLYGLRLSEILGLRWRNVDLEKGVFRVVEQLPFGMPANTKILSEMAPVKSEERDLYITDVARKFFERQLALQNKRRLFCELSGSTYYENDLVVAKENGSPCRRDRASANFGLMLRHSGMAYIRFHDLRHTAATNMHQLTGDFYTVGKILGHSLKGIGIQLGISTSMEATTAQYVDVRLDRIKIVLQTYHDHILPKKYIEQKKTQDKKKGNPVK